MTKNNSYTYKDFALNILDAIGCDTVNAALKEAGFDTTLIAEKAQALLDAQVKKAEYNATHKRTSTSKMSDETKALIENLKKVLKNTPQTGAELNKAMGTEYTALRIANAVAKIDGVKSTKVVRTTVNSKGLKADREYTAYFVE